MDPALAARVALRFGELMEIDAGDLDFDARLDDVYKVSSLNRLRLLHDLERELRIDIRDDEGKNLCTLRAVVELCARHRQPHSG
jgi:acyl carrier protein